jgi:hypothetical protein
LSLVTALKASLLEALPLSPEAEAETQVLPSTAYIILAYSSTIWELANCEF